VVVPLAVVSVLAFLTLAAVARAQYFFPLDYTVQALAQGARNPLLEAPMRAVTLLGSGWVLAPLSALGWVGLRRLGHPLARFVPATVVGAFLLGAVTKWLVSRPRPRGSDYGFPSGHTLGAAVFFGAVVYVLWTLGVPRVPRWLGTLLACLLVLGVAWSRLYLRSHWLSDVVGGLAGGLAYLLVALIVIERRLRAPPT
jgi:membrane-associated phospholipid phosphatase